MRNRLLTKKEMISEIVIHVKAGGAYIGGDMFLQLAFMPESALRKMCAELHIKTTVPGGTGD